MLRTAQSLPPSRAFDAGLRRRAFPPDAASLLPGLLAATRTRTHTGKRRRAYEREDPPWHYVTVSPPALLGARKPEANADHNRTYRTRLSVYPLINAMQETRTSAIVRARPVAYPEPRASTARRRVECQSLISGQAPPRTRTRDRAAGTRATNATTAGRCA